jgi:Xaa-Pro aminopeptidase
MAETPRPILANVTRLHHYMDHAGCAAVVVRSGKNFTYLAGFAYPGTLARHLDFPDSPREVLLLWPRHGEPVMVLNHYAAPLAQRDALQRIEVYDDYAESPYERVARCYGSGGCTPTPLAWKDLVRAARWEEMQRPPRPGWWIARH